MGSTPCAQPLRRLVTIVRAILAVALVGAFALPQVADTAPGDKDDRYRGEQLLVSRAVNGGPVGQAVEQPVISQDNRKAVAIAYVSKSNDVVRPGRTGGVRNIYLVHRRRPFDRNAEDAWRAGKTEMVSRGRKAPNGDSWAPILSGDDNYGAKCLVFASEASNLVAGDRNRRADAFVRYVKPKRLVRIAGEGAVKDVSVDGGCKRVAYASSAGVFIKTLGGGSERVSGGSARRVSMNAWAGSLAFERRGAIYYWKRTTGVRNIGKGRNPHLSGNAKMLVYERGGSTYGLNLQTKRKRRIGKGVDPTTTLAGTFIFWASDKRIETVGLKKPAAQCDSGPRSPSTSAHGNYVLYLCVPDDGSSEHRQLYLSYIGGKSHGQR